jgi:hypothetical protein
MKPMLLLSALCLLLPTQDVIAQTARVQLVHVAPDPAIETVDVYLNGERLIDDFQYRTATAYLDIPAGRHLITFAPADSREDDLRFGFYEIEVELQDGETYSMMAAGLHSPRSFAPNPYGIDRSFRLFVKEGARETYSETPGHFHVRQFYAIPDMPRTEFKVGGFVTQPFDYGEFGDFAGVRPGVWTSYLKAAGPAVAAYSASSFNSAGYEGLGVLEIFSGLFYTGEGIDIEVLNVLPDGTVDRQLKATTTFRAQMIHASADPAVGSVDIYMDGGPLYRGLDYRKARPYIDLPVGWHHFTVYRAGDKTKPLVVRKSLFGKEGRPSQFALIGVADTENFNPNPDGRDISLDVLAMHDAMEAYDNPHQFRGRQLFAVTDMPPANFMAQNFAVSEDMKFGDYSPYSGTTPGVRTAYVRAYSPASAPWVKVDFDSRDHGGSAWTQVFSGFFAGESGLDIDWFLVHADGSVTSHTVTTQEGRIQFVHAAPDPDVESVDLYVDGGLLVKDLSYKSATPYITLPSGLHYFDVVASTSNSRDESLLRRRTVLGSKKTHSMVLAGVVDPEGWAPNPDDHSLFLGLFLARDAQEAASQPTHVAVREFLGVTDLASVDLWSESDGSTVFMDIEYCQFSPVYDGELEGILTGAYRLTGASNRDARLFWTSHDWSGYDGTSVLEVVTGTTDDLHWFQVFPNGDVHTHAIVMGTVDVEDVELEIPSDFAILGNYPNPFNPSTSITFDLPDAASVRVQVFDATGRMLMETKEATFTAGAGHAVQVDATAWGSGLYLYKVIARARTSSWIGSGRMMLVK